MPRRESPSGLPELIRAIGALDEAAANRLLAAHPSCAQESLEVATTRQNARGWYFERIVHYAYAGDTALHLAAAAYLPALTGRLLELGANPSARNRRGAEPLHYAADGMPGSTYWNPAAQCRVIELLVKGGADPNVRNADGVTPLHRAIRTRCSAAVAALMKTGADPRLANAAGSTPWQLASVQSGRGGTGSKEAREEQARILELLSAYGT